MSSVVDFRDRVIEHIKASVPELRSVDWYDGLFDEEDVKEWSVQAPAAYVAVVSIPDNKPHQTGEMNTTLRVIVTVVTEDRYTQKDNDRQNWAIMEKIASAVNLSTFGDPNAAQAEGPMLKRLRDPELRREGIALGVVEWDSGFTFGIRTQDRHEYAYSTETDERLVDMPTMNAFLGYSEVDMKRESKSSESVNLRRPDDASPWIDEDA